MKKSSFLEGAFVVTVAIVICKIIGLVYVIPFYHIIGDQGGALYGYAYSIYAVFLSLSSSGIPLAMSKVVSEYNTLGYYHLKEKVYRIGRFMITSLGVLSFIIMVIFAETIASFILGDLEGGNSIESVALVIRIVATAMLIVPLQSVTRGYLQGHKFMTVPSISTVIEQIVRVVIIVVGSYLALRVFGLSLDTAVGISVFAATIGALVSYFYIILKMKKSKSELHLHESATREEAKVSSKDLVKKITFYAFPFILIELFKSAYAMVDTFTMVSTMATLGFGNIAELTIGVFSTWAPKLNMIIISIAIGISISLTPNIASSFIKKDFKDVSRKVNQALSALLYVCLPMTIGLSFLAQSAWVMFYGYNEISIDIFRYFILQSLPFCLFSILITLMQTMNHTKLVLFTLVGSFLGKVLLNVPSMYLMDILELPVYYGPILVTMVTQLLPVIFMMYLLNKKYQINYRDTLLKSMKLLLSTAIMIVVLMILSQFVSLEAMTRMESLWILGLYAVVGSFIYLFVTYRSGLVKEIFGERVIHGIVKKLKLEKLLKK